MKKMLICILTVLFLFHLGAKVAISANSSLSYNQISTSIENRKSKIAQLGEKEREEKELRELLNKATTYSFEYLKKREAYQKSYGPAFKFIFDGINIKDIIYLRTGKSIFLPANNPNSHTPQEINEIIEKECPNMREIFDREYFPYAHKIAIALEEYSSYFLFWEAYAYSFSDRGKAKRTLEEVAQRYEEVDTGKLAKSILEKAKDEEELISLIREEFKKLPNRVETYKPKGGEPENSVMNNLKSALASSIAYKRWKKGTSLSNLKSAIDEAEIIVEILDALIAHQYFYLSNFVNNKENLKRYTDIILYRFPHTQTGKFLKSMLKK